jgi:beta-lactamase class C
VDGITIVDKPGGLSNASAYIGFVPARKVGIILLANRSDFPYEIARNRMLSELSRLQ